MSTTVTQKHDRRVSPGVRQATDSLQESLSIDLEMVDGKWHATRFLDHFGALGESDDAPELAVLRCALQVLESGCNYDGRCGA